jgi:outer membrane autotransporter protein
LFRDPGPAGNAPQDLPSVKDDARGFSVLGNFGYQIPLGTSGWFIEPSAGVAWSRVTVDPVTMVDSSGFGVALRADDIESILGRASLRIGGTIASGSFTWQPFLTGSVFREFAGKTTMSGTVLDPNGDCKLAYPGGAGPNFKTDCDGTTFTSATERIGTYGQLGLGTSIIVGDTGWLGFVRSDAKVGEHFRGVSVATGMRYQW